MYQYLFVAALEKSIKGFENKFNVHAEPEKMTFKGRSGKSFSFDFAGFYRFPPTAGQVFGECKGYSKGTSLIPEFRSFLARAYVTSIDHTQHRNDLFWFVTNVPFACNEGSGLRRFEFVRSSLTKNRSDDVHEILGAGDIDDQQIRYLIEHLGVFILTDTFLRSVTLSYKVKKGENYWRILENLHGGRIPRGNFRKKAEEMARDNQLSSPDRIPAGKRLDLRWYGVNWTSWGDDSPGGY